jgi:hypothetical protein
MKMSQYEGNGSGEKRSRTDKLQSLQDLPAVLREKAQRNPLAALALIGGGAFILGGLVASRVGRFAIAAAIPVVISRVLEGPLGKEIVSQLATAGGSPAGTVGP